MESDSEQRMRKGTGTVYRIVVSGELSARYASAFEGMEMEVRGGQTILTGEVIDQPHLHGILDHIGALGLKLMSIESVPGEPQAGSTDDGAISAPESTDNLKRPERWK